MSLDVQSLNVRVVLVTNSFFYYLFSCAMFFIGFLHVCIVSYVYGAIITSNPNVDYKSDAIALHHHSFGFFGHFASTFEPNCPLLSIMQSTFASFAILAAAFGYSLGLLFNYYFIVLSTHSISVRYYSNCIWSQLGGGISFKNIKSTMKTP